MGNPPRKVEVTEQDLRDAIDSEAALGARAAEVRGEADDPAPCFRELWSIAREPIPAGFLSEVTAGEGKPYPSKGVRSLQVQIDRMDAVWTPLWWGWRTEWLNDGKLAEVTVWIGPSEADALVTRSARGGMNRGSTDGNLYKGTETNAAKLAFARIGPGHEVYLGAADFDPDTDKDAAEEQARAPHASGTKDPNRKLPPEKVEPLRIAVFGAGLGDHLEMKLASFGVTRLEDLTVDQALAVYEWAKAEVVGEPEEKPADG